MPEPVIAQKLPILVQLEEGKTYLWCACGRSADQPFCDGSHKGTGFTPVEFTATRNGRARFCGCKLTERAPICDGAHNRL